MSALGAVFAREARLAFAGGGGPAGPAAYFLAALTLAPLALGPAGATLAAAGPGVIAFAALLAVLQGAERLHGEDVADGTLDLHALSGLALPLIAFARTAGWGLATLWPLVPVGFIAGVSYGLSVRAALMLTGALACAIPGLAFIASFAGALAAGVKRAGLLIALIAAPLMIPLLVFAAAAGREAHAGDERALANLLLTAAASLFVMALSPFAIAAALKTRLE
ncbi:heme exporter protein CcmB [Hyphobacterium marinum]|uniref:Heme exporter protein B n=1 Tax=Hyphobacterium marinum TaxID=3116574 RepID=A0ABU7LVF4_9PROT|nr:heme exporter protein CcmB [Hyphobacterium sp. Y6023]MEE2565543.1 heme exporter protein CcmB [Hyphobacterium sp. Y6023]